LDKPVATVVNLDKCRIDEVLHVVKDLRQQGLTQGQEFDFAWHPARWDNMIGDIPSRVEFRFYDDKWAAWFSLKWA
jgi:hypothetical protein